MTTSEQKDKAVSKLECMADKVVIQNRAYKRTLAPAQRQDPEYGRLNKSIKELQEATEKCRKSTGGEP